MITYRVISLSAYWFLTYSSTSGHMLPHSATFYDTTAEQMKNVAGHQAKSTVVLALVLKRD